MDKPDYNAKIKEVYDEFNEAPTMVSPSGGPVTISDTTTFTSETNHSTANQLSGMNKTEFDTVAKPL